MFKMTTLYVQSEQTGRCLCHVLPLKRQTSLWGEPISILSKLEYEKSKVDLLESKKTILIELDNANSEYQFALNSYNNSVESLRLAEKIEKKNQIKFLEGLISGLDLRQAQLQLYSIQNQLLQSMVEVITKKINLEIILTQN